MAPTAPSLVSNTPIEDVLEYLPVSQARGYRKGQMIYGPDKLSTSLYLVVAGKVEISQIAEDGTDVLLEILRPDELFGESGFLDTSRPFERAIATEKAILMTWAISDIEDLLMKRPRLAVALLQILAQRNAEFTRRIESFSIDTTERRLARSLIRFSERFGNQEADGSVRMMPLTHGTLSRYVGTSRGIVTKYMSQFRKQGYVSYSRRGIHLYCDSLKTFLDESGVPSAKTSSY